MNITIVTIGTRGDVEPFVALGDGLRRSGHHVRIATHGMFESFVRSYGLDFALISGDVQAAINSAESRDVLEKSKGSTFFLREVGQQAAPLVETAVRELADACTDADHLMCTPLSLYLAFFMAQELRIPISVGCVNPAGATREFHNVVVSPPYGWLPRLITREYNILSHKIIGDLVWIAQRPYLNQAWQKVFGHRLPIREPLVRHFTKVPPLMLYAYSSHILPKPPDWSVIQQVTGYWFLKPLTQWKPDPALEAFLAAGEKPVYIGFGSMNNDRHKTGSLKKLIVDVAKRSGHRVVLLNAGLGFKPHELPSNAYATAPVPFEYLFPRMAALVHHGGAGTTAIALRSGVPSVITPLICDQAFWAWCVRNQGASAEPIPWNKMTVDNLTSAINTVMTDTNIMQRAKDIGERIRAEDGVAEAVRLFNKYYAGTAGPLREVSDSCAPLSET